jgi:Skp family chaperone for outer membrane proteins
MLESQRGLRLIVLAAIVLCIVASMTGAKAGDDKGGLRIAVVDMQKLNDEYTLIKDFRDAAEKQDKDFKVEYEVLQRHALLPDADQKKLIELTIKDRNNPASLSKADLASKTELEKTSNALREDFVKLQQTPVGAVGPNDETKLKNYTKQVNDTQAKLTADQQRMQADVENKAKELNVTVQDKMQKALTDVAKKNGYTLVLSKQIAPYAEFDCTKDVLTQINKKTTDKN